MYRTSELTFVGEPEVCECEAVMSRFRGQFFVVASVSGAEDGTARAYLHRDGRWGRFTARDEDLSDFSGYYETRKAAEEALRRYCP